MRERMLACKVRGYQARKWLVRHAPTSEPERQFENVAVPRTLRMALRGDWPIMLDCSQSFDYPYFLPLTERI